jgi:hypothetical protein
MLWVIQGWRGGIVNTSTGTSHVPVHWRYFDLFIPLRASHPLPAKSTEACQIVGLTLP